MYTQTSKVFRGQCAGIAGGAYSQAGRLVCQSCPNRWRGVDLVRKRRILLTVAIPARESDKLIPLFRLRVGNILAMLGINAGVIERELTHLKHVQFGKTASRSLLGSMNDFAQMYQYKAEAFTGEGTMSLSMTELNMSEVPCKPLKYASADMVTRELLEGKG